MTEWTKEKEKKVLWKYRFVLTARIVRVILIMAFLYGIYMMLLSIAYQATNLPHKHSFYTKVALDWTGQGLETDFSSYQMGTIGPLLTQKIEYPVYRRVGKEQIPVGEMKIAKRIVTPFSERKMDFFMPNEGSKFNFFLPVDPRTGETLYQKQDAYATTWDALEKVHEGTVADMAFSTTKYVEPSQLLMMLEPYDVDVVWMPLYAGEIKEFEVGYSIAGASFMNVETLGVSSARETTDDYSSSSYSTISSETIERIQASMLTNMRKLIDEESTSYREHFLGLRHLEERYDYLQENGFKVYGAVVTGPVRELLKLREVDVIQTPILGEFEYWNWEERTE